YNIVGTTVDVSVANVKFKVLGTGCIVNLTINDELFLLYSGYIFWPTPPVWEEAISGLVLEPTLRISKVDVPKVETFANGIIIKTHAIFHGYAMHVYGTFTVYNTGVIVVNITYVAWNRTSITWPGARNIFPYPYFNGLKCFVIMNNGNLTTLPHDDQQGWMWGRGWVCYAMPSPATPNTYLVTITLLPYPYVKSEFRFVSGVPIRGIYGKDVFSHLIRELGGWTAKAGDSITWLYILYPHTKGEEFTKELLTIGWKLDGIMSRFTQVKQHARFTKHVISNVKKSITECFNTLAMGDTRRAESIVDSISSGIVRAYRIELGTTYFLIMGVPAAIIAFLLIKYTRKW
ncbi:MAG: hypothetical protein DRZ82_04105, partial [Thermoprotei archaeon]